MVGERIESMMDEKRVFQPPQEHRDTAYVKSMEEYQAAYKRSMDDPEGYWLQRTKELVTWFKEPTKILEWDFKDPNIKWFKDGSLNVSYNCLDRHVQSDRRNKAAIIWQGEADADVKVYTYQMLLTEVCKFANVLKKKGVQKGDRVAIYLPMVPELAIAMLACVRIGAAHSIVFAGFSANSLRDRIQDCGANILITGTAVNRGGRVIPLKPNADEALADCPLVKTCVVVNSAKYDAAMAAGRDVLVARGDGRGRHQGRVRARGDERRGRALHPVHLGLHGQAQGRVPHHGRLSDLCGAHHAMGLRHS